MFCIFSISEQPISNTNKLFFKTYKSTTDAGACCFISQHLNFVNPETVNTDLEDITGDTWNNIPSGSLNGELGGLKFLLDAESFAFSNREKHSNGFRIAFSDHHDKHLLTHDSYFISTGKYK
jgi:hypothetical protein